jgi:hypothetical protein
LKTQTFGFARYCAWKILPITKPST